MVKEKENNVLTLVRAGGDALDVELLHDDKQDGDGMDTSTPPAQKSVK